MVDQRSTPSDMGSDPPVEGPERAEWARVLEDWVTIWQSEMAGMVLDREVQEALLRAGDLWAAQARAAAGMLAPMLQAVADDGAHGRAGADAAAGSTAVDAAPAGRDQARERRDSLLDRPGHAAELDRRVGGPSPAGAAPGA